MPKYRILPEESFRDLQRLVNRLGEALEEAGELNLPESMVQKPDEQGETDGWVGSRAKYTISRSQYQYIDVVEQEMDEEVFSLDELWERIRPLIRTQSKRPRDALRTAVDRDERYERLQDRSGVWWRYVGEDSADDEDQAELSAM